MDELVIMCDSQIFHKSIKGASHILSGKPCQDYSDVFQNDEMKILVVCDGHGGSTYIRSDVGAKIATEITIQLLSDFVRCIPSSTFIGLSFSITAQPKKNPFIDTDGNKLRFDELSEDQKALALQAQAFLESEKKCPQQQAIIMDLISQIYKAWISKIEEDVHIHPFNKEEQKAINGQGFEKAYGCTLLAFLQTKDYWLSFHIGDGRIMCCDQSLNWSNPVPYDCACFLNYTTSLCDSNPLIEFRYAFNGYDAPPLAVMLCSDGLDGSLRTDDNLQDFYEQIIGLCVDGDDVEKELEGYLPSLSQSGSKDDISIAGIVSFHHSDDADIRKKMKLKKRSRSIKNDYRARKTEIDAICSKIEVLEMKYERMKDNRFSKQMELDDMRQLLRNREKEVSEMDTSVNSLRKEIEDLKSEMKRKKTEFENWKFTVKNEMAELESEQNETVSTNNNEENFYTNW